MWCAAWLLPSLDRSEPSYDAAFVSQDWGRGAAIAFVLFAIIVVFTVLQRLVLGRDNDRTSRRMERARLQAAAHQQAATTVTT